MDMSALIYLPDNPKDLLELGINAMAKFDNNMDDLDNNFMVTSNNGIVPDLLSLSGQVVYSQYRSLRMFELTKSHSHGYIATRLIDENKYYSSHMQFLDAIITQNTEDLIDFILPRCIVNIELFDETYYVADSREQFGCIEKTFSHTNLIDSIKDFMYFSINEFNCNNLDNEIDSIINRIVRLEEFIAKYLIYVPSKLE